MKKYWSQELKRYVTVPEDEIEIGQEADFDTVVGHLRTDAGLTDAEVQASGGGIDVIRIPVGSEYVLYFGTAAEVWGASVYRVLPGGDEEHEDDIWTDVPSNETDPSAVALGITKASMDFDQGHGGAKSGSKTAADLAVGLAVTHPKFGDGLVKAVSGDNATVMFQSGQKTMRSGFLSLIDPNEATEELGKEGTYAPYTSASVQQFASYCLRNGYRLYVVIHKEAERKKVEAEYAGWSGGKALPSECVKESFVEYGETFEREWFLETIFEEGMPSPWKVVNTGTRGRGNISRKAPIAYREKSGKFLIRYAPAVAEAVRAGLEAQM